jgi:hypothetical protein
LRIYERCLEFDADRALKWSFATTARAMLELLEGGAVR